MKLLLSGVIALGLMAASASASTVTFFKDQASFLAATAGGTSTSEQFSAANSTSERSISFASGLTSEAIGGRLRSFSNIPLAGFYNGEVDSRRFPQAPAEIKWTLDTAVHAISFQYFESTAGDLGVQVGSTASNASILSNGDGSLNGFFGFVSTTPVDTFSFFNRFGAAGVNQFAIDNLRMITLPDAAVIPLPASLPLLLAGLGGLALMRRGRKA